MNYDLSKCMTEDDLAEQEKKLEFMRKNKKRIVKLMQGLKDFLTEFQREVENR